LEFEWLLGANGFSSESEFKESGLWDYS